jgi:tetratricopeptide (TPR) repeat protein
VLLKELETMFANDFSSPVFPILAEYYLEDNQLDRALKVCKIGLKHSLNNMHGKFILSKVLIKEKKIKEAEKKLKEIAKNSLNVEGLFLLIDISIKLNRSASAIKQYVEKLNYLLPEHKKVKQYKKKYLLPKKKSQAKEPIASIQKKSTSVNIDDKLATKTMYNLLYTQKRYYHALEVLNIMSLHKKNVQFIKKNKPDLLKKINKRS